MNDAVLTTLHKVTEHLWFPSEADAPLEPFVWEDAENTPAVIRRRSRQPAQTRCRTIAAAHFFDDLAEVAGFTALYDTLKATLTDLRVYLYGEGTITVYVVGRDAHGRLVGFKTDAVEM